MFLWARDGKLAHMILENGLSAKMAMVETASNINLQEVVYHSKVV